MIAVVGLGYVGLPLARQFARCGTTVVGIDTDIKKVDALAAGKSYIAHITGSDIQALVQSQTLQPTTDFARVSECEAIIICVPTPLTKNREPDISYILGTAKCIAPHLKPGTLVVLESTTYPGTTEDELRETLESLSGLKAGIDFHLAFSPEREDPGNPESDVSRIPKVVGGYTPTGRDLAVNLYNRIVARTIPVSNCRTAEATKLLENIFRSVNIALVNELKVVYDAMGIDIWEVIEAAKTKPFGYMPFYPGPGLGGHCIPIDPFYLTWKAREYGQATRFIELAGEVNTRMPEYVIRKLADALNDDAKPLKNSRVLVVGLAYKANVDDPRESPAFVLLDLLAKAGSQVDYYDPHIPVIGPMREHMHWKGKQSIDWSQEKVASFDASIICTAHKAVNYQELVDWCKLVVDTRNATRLLTPQGRVVRA